jgi:hypothetical protein
MTTQAPPLQQSRDTFGGGILKYKIVGCGTKLEYVIGMYVLKIIHV